MFTKLFVIVFLFQLVFCEQQQHKPRVCVIGGGVSGLSVAYYLQKGGLAHLDVFEKADDIGGTWQYDPNVGTDEDGSPVHSSMYKSLRTNLPRHTMEFPDFPMPEEVSSFPTANCFFKYIQTFADRFGLRKHVKLNHEVTSVKRETESWKVQYRQRNDTELKEQEYDYILVCNGHNFEPNWPDNINDVHNNFSGIITHSHDYREPGIFKDKKVLIIGAGPSAIDIGVEVAYVASRLIHSHHRKAFTSPFPRHYIQKPDVKVFLNNSVVFADGTNEDVDVIIYCTGYQYYYPFLDNSAELHLPLSHVSPLYRNTVNINQPSMLLFGLGVHGVVTFAIHVQARYAASLIMGNFTLPSKKKMMEEWQTKVDDINRSRRHLKVIHDLSPKEMEYYDSMTEEAGLAQVPRVMVRIGHVATSAKLKNWYTFRLYHYRIKNDTIFTVEYRPGDEICDLDI